MCVIFLNLNSSLHNIIRKYSLEAWVCHCVQADTEIKQLTVSPTDFQWRLSSIYIPFFSFKDLFKSSHTILLYNQSVATDKDILPAPFRIISETQR